MVVLLAPVVYLVGNIGFKRVVMGRLPLSHGVGLGLMVVVAVWETRSYRRGRVA